MPRNQPNFGLQRYVDDNGTGWSKRGEIGGPFAGVDGHATRDATEPVWVGESRRKHVRRVIAQDAVTFRTRSAIIYTRDAYDAIDTGDTIAVPVTGLATDVNYTVIEKKPERTPSVRLGAHLADS